MYVNLHVIHMSFTTLRLWLCTLPGRAWIFLLRSVIVFLVFEAVHKRWEWFARPDHLS